jgi:serine phosphatase RsbU (regulator of sigma subunit)
MQAGGEPGRAGFSMPSGVDPGQVQRLARVTGELSAAVDMAGIADAAVTHIADAIHAAVATLLVVQGDRLVMVGGHGLQPGTDVAWASFALDHANPASEAARTGRQILIGDSAEAQHRYPSLAGWMPAGRSLVNLPLGRPAAGVLGLTFEDGWLPGPAELDLLTTFADACGQAIRRVQAADEARATAERLTFLSQASAELASSLDYRATLGRVARLAVPTLADWCTVQILDDSGELRTVAVEHVDPAKVAWAWQLESRYPPQPDAPTGAPNVVRTGVSELYEVITDEMLAASAVDAEHLRLSRSLNLRSAMIAPLRTPSRTLGAITFIRAETDQTYTPADLAVAEDLAGRAAVSIENARLHRETEGIALQLQRAVLPEHLDRIPGWEVVTHYEPAGPADVGGDFYDAVLLDDGLAVFIGDVMGRGIAAAAAMAQLRAAVRAYLCVDPAPDVVLPKLDRMIARLGLTRLATLLYARIQADRPELDLISAGHLPALVVGADGTRRWVDAAVQRPLGTPPGERRATTVPFAPGETLLLYTDGLVERRDQAIDEGLDRLAEKAGVLAASPLPDALPALVAALDRNATGDDVTAVAVRRSA